MLFLLTWYFGGFPQQWGLDIAIFPGHQYERLAMCVWHPEHGDTVPAGHGGVDESVVCKHFHGCMAQGLLAYSILHLNPEGKRRLWSNIIIVRGAFLLIHPFHHTIDIILFCSSFI